MIGIAATVGLIGMTFWLLRGGRDPLIHLVPVALAFPPLIAYGGKALGWPGGWLSTRVALLFCIALFIAFRLARRDFGFSRVPGMWFIGPHLLLVIGSVVWAVLGPYNSEAFALANEFVSWTIPVVIFFLVAGSLHGEADLRRACQVLIGVAVGVVAYSGLQALVLTGNERLVPGPITQLTLYGRDELWFGAFRLYGTLPNLGPNFLGAFLLFPTVLAFSRAFTERGLSRLPWLTTALAGVGVVTGTYSRGSMLALAIALTTLAVWRRSLRGLATVVSGIGLAAFLAAQTPVGRYAASLYSGGQLDVSGSSRVFLWRAILRSAAEHPVGLGFNAWPLASRASEEVGLLDPPESIGAAHPAENQWLRELADRGIPGVLALGLLIIGFIRATFRAGHPNRSHGYALDVLASAGAVAVGWSIAFATGDHLMYDSVAGMFWYMIALALVAIRDSSLWTRSEHPEESGILVLPR